jgi:hypothetical protein
MFQIISPVLTAPTDQTIESGFCFAEAAALGNRISLFITNAFISLLGLQREPVA